MRKANDKETDSGFAAITIAALLIALALACAATAQAKPGGKPRAGTLVRSFGAQGILRQDFGTEPGSGGAAQTIVAPDGSFLVLTDLGAIGHFLPDGSLDTGFGQNGYLLRTGAVAMTQLPGGDIVTASNRSFPSTKVTFARFDAAGRPDRAFGNEGTAVYAARLAGGFEQVVAEPDGRVLAVGRPAERQDDPALTVMRLLPNGAPDPSFGSDGVALIALPESVGGGNELRATALDAGRLTVAISAGSAELLVLRLDSGGHLDPAFGAGTGMVRRNILEGVPSGIQVLPDGRLLIGSTSGGRFARLLPNGDADPSFGEGGGIVVDALKGVEGVGVALLQDGSFVSAGFDRVDNNSRVNDFIVARLDADGNLDPAFGAEGTGIVRTDIAGSSNDEATGMTATPGGALLVSGITNPPEGYRSRIGAALYRTDGSLEPGFGAGGILIARPLTVSADQVSDMVLDKQGRILIAGAAEGGIRVSRYRRSGRLDPAFGVGGRVGFSITGDYFGESGSAIASYPGGRILVGTESETGAALLMLRPDGSLDPRFGAGGIVRDPDVDAYADIVVLSDGKVVAAGFKLEPCKSRLVRYNADGSRDASFGDGGRVNGEFLAGPCSGRNLNLAVRRNGNVVLGGQTNYAVLREYSAQGGILRNFLRTKSVRDIRPRPIGAVAIDSRGRLLVGAMVDRKQALVRFTRKGRLDASFGRGGVATRKVGYQATVGDMTIDGRGRIVLAGRAKECERLFCDYMAALTRFGAGGEIDRGFGKRGTWIGPRKQENVIRSVLLDGHAIVAGGWTGDYSDRDILLVGLHR